MQVCQCLGDSAENVPDETFGDVDAVTEVVFQHVLEIAETAVFVEEDGFSWSACVAEHLDDVGMRCRQEVLEDVGFQWLTLVVPVADEIRGAF